MDILLRITYFLFTVHLVRAIIYWLNLWQIKEYRLDRLLVHIRETQQGRSIIFGFEPVAKTAVIIFYFFTIFYADYYPLVPFAVIVIYLYESIRFIADIIQNKVKLPVFTPKLIAIAAVTTVMVFLFLQIYLLDQYFWFVFVDKFVIWIIATLIGLFSFPSMFYKDTQINKAIKKIRKHKKLLVIGITGSYGKGSTKEYMYSILSTKFNTLKTPSTHNTPIGIARVILSKLNKKTEVFIVEMGAYKIGEIAEMCDFVQPKIGVLTAVNEQHVSLFGSVENTKSAKYEIIESLPPRGIALFNGNNEITKELFRKTRKRGKYLYFTGNKQNKEADIYASNIKVHPTFLTFDVTIGKNKMKNLKANLVGEHHIQNILPGIFIGNYLKMSDQEITDSIQTINPLYKTMEPFRGVNDALYIDDTFNANPASVISAVDYLSHQKGEKVMVLQPMIELGKNGKKDHYNVAKKIGSVCTNLYLTNKNFYQEIKKGIEDSGNKCKVVVLTPKQISREISKLFGENDVIVFEGKESQSAFDLLSHSPIYSNT